MHNRDFDYKIDGKIENKTKKEWEAELGLTGIIVRMEKLGWEIMNWSYEKPEDIEKYKNFTHFVECTGPYYTDFLRGDSKISLKDAFEKVLNKMEKFNQCEIRDGHDFTSREGYDNGVLSCKKCGFGGYTNLVEITKNEKELYENMYKGLIKKISNMNSSMIKIGNGLSGFNMFGGIIINGQRVKDEELGQYEIIKKQ